MRKSLIYGLNSLWYFFSNVLKYSLTYNLRLNTVSWAQWISVLTYCIHSIYCHVLFKCIYYKMGHAQALQITKEFALWAYFSMNCINLMISSSFPLSFTKHSSSRRYYSNVKRLFKQKWKRGSIELESSLF